MGKKSYTDKFRAAAVVMLEAEGYPGIKGALARVSRSLDIPLSTLHGWARAKNNPPPSEVRSEKKGELIEAIRNEVWAALGDMPTARTSATYRDLTVAIGILVDKLQLLSNEPTARVELLELAHELRKQGEPNALA